MKIIETTNSILKPALFLLAGLFLVSCGGGNSSSQTITDVRPDASVTPASRIVFDAGAGDIPLPSDLLFSGTSDGTLEMPDETAGRAAGSIDYGNPAVALGGADGWSPILPMQVSLNMVDGATVDATTVNGSTVVMIQTVTPPTDGSGAGCIPVEPFISLSPGLPCGVVAPLTYGVDYVAVAGADSITIAPLSPLDAKTTYVVGILDGVMDSRGEAVLASTQYEQVTRSDVDIDFPSLDSLQDAVNLYEAIIDLGTGGDGSAPADALFTAAWTTASVGDVVGTATTVLAATPPSIADVTSAGVTVAAAFVGLGLLDPVDAATSPLALADLYSAEVTLPYYSGTPEDGSDPLTDNWAARCDNPLAIGGAAAAGLLPDPVEPNNSICAAINSALGDYGLDTERHLTKYNPVPAVRDSVTLEVQITVPNAGTAFAAGPWPVVIMQHGITADKEGMLAISGALASAGFATFAIDHPLHGSRGLESALTGEEANAGTDATAYMNLSYLLVTRDNERQSIADLLGLRMAIGNSIGGALTDANFDTTNVHFLGMSLGGISGTGFTAQANSLGLGLDIQSAALVVPGGGLAALLIESPSFGSLIQGSVLAGSGTTLGNAFIGFIGTNATCAGDIGCNFNDFVATLDATSLAEIGGLVGQFGFAAQTITDPADPINYAAGLVALGTPIYMSEIVGDGVNNLSDQVIPNQTVNPGFTFGGTEPLAAFLGLTGVDADNSPQASGIVRFTDGSHSSLLDPTTSLGVTTEMQTQTATFFAADLVLVTDATDVLDLP
jgi:Pla-1/cef family extracellular lipase